MDQLLNNMVGNPDALKDVLQALAKHGLLTTAPPNSVLTQVKDRDAAVTGTCSERIRKLEPR